MAGKKFAQGGPIPGPGGPEDDRVMIPIWNDCPLIPARVAERMRDHERREQAKGGD